MSFSYPTVTLGSNTYPVYIDDTGATTYLDATITEAGTAWRAADAGTQSRALVSATRWLDSAKWVGTQSDPTQSLQWPRVINGIDPSSIPIQVAEACAELAAELCVDPDLQVTMRTPLVKEQHAGSAGQTFFRPLSVQTTSFFPPNIMNFISQWLMGQGVVGAIANDVKEKSELRRPFDFQHGL